jgi:hypothetical protein
MGLKDALTSKIPSSEAAPVWWVDCIHCGCMPSSRPCNGAKVAHCEHCDTDIGNSLDIIAEWEAESRAHFNVWKEGRDMISKIEFEIRRTLPGSEYDYQRLLIQDVTSETEEPAKLQDRWDAIIESATKNAATVRKMCLGVNEKGK